MNKVKRPGIDRGIDRAFLRTEAGGG